ncbi:GNAT family N-acetyltransferase [Secundilactobacillus folii]|uniref:GNAT family N-acetyltransferase n=1 Tax=Secundilactobacillus folii TaxID=2678357 RepID=A0A7X2XXD4_9LACO|nr:GNAT family N-acetyltransferase [Secundilactobacillus folii]MTV82086.1 GNAT family N-acetyltransferase [Secundilactobacillus folii]
MKIKSAKGTNGQVYQDAIAIRQAVFVTEQGIAPDLEFDGLDDQVRHYVGYVSDQPAVTARIRQDGSQVRIQRVATLAKYRHQGYAAALLKQIIADAAPGSLFELNAQETAIGLYEQLGFKQTGAPFEEVGIRHVTMIKQK